MIIARRKGRESGTMLMLKHLLRHGRITEAEAERLNGIRNPGRTAGDLRRQGWNAWPDGQGGYRLYPKGETGGNRNNDNDNNNNKTKKKGETI